MPKSIIFEELKKQFAGQNAVPSRRRAGPAKYLQKRSAINYSARIEFRVPTRAHFVPWNLASGRSVIYSHFNQPRN
jgi:hypothetical protein